MEFKKNMDLAAEKARKIKLFAHDVHGVLTPNTFNCDIEGKRKYTFWHMDGFGDLSLSANAIQIAFLDTTSIDEEGLYRARELKLDKFYYRIKDKVAKLNELKNELKIEDENICFVGCEITDLAAVQKAGFGVATADAVNEVKEAADYITGAPGGRGPIREICEFILQSMGKWDEWVVKVTKMGYK